FASARRHTMLSRDWSSVVCSSDLPGLALVASRPGVPDTNRPLLTDRKARTPAILRPRPPPGVGASRSTLQKRRRDLRQTRRDPDSRPPESFERGPRARTARVSDRRSPVLCPLPLHPALLPPEASAVGPPRVPRARSSPSRSA